MARKKLRNISNRTAKSGFVSPMGHYLRYGDWDKSEVAGGEGATLTDRGRTYNTEDMNMTQLRNVSHSQGYKAFRKGGRLYKVRESGYEERTT